MRPPRPATGRRGRAAGMPRGPSAAPAPAQAARVRGPEYPGRHGVAAAGDPMWQRRGNKLYYYRTQRVGRRVVRAYFGSGPEAVLAAALDAARRAERAARAAARPGAPDRE